MQKALLKKMRKSKKGFTLIELIVVIAILAILAAILIPSVMGIVKTANDSAYYADANTVFLAAQVYMAQNPSTTLTGLTNTQLEPFLGANFDTNATVSATISVGTITSAYYTPKNGAQYAYPKS